jgi:hypothetical protein
LKLETVFAPPQRAHIHRRSGLLFVYRPAAPGAPSVANVLRAVHRGRIVLLDA